MIYGYIFIPGWAYGVRLGHIEPIGSISVIKESPEKKLKEERVYHGLEDLRVSMLSLGTTTAEDKAYKLLGVHSGSSAHEVLGLSPDITLANLGPDRYHKAIRDAYGSKNRQLFTITPSPSSEVKNAYTRITAEAFHNLGGWAEQAGFKK